MLNTYNDKEEQDPVNKAQRVLRARIEERCLILCAAEKILKNSREKTTRGGPPAGGLAEVLTTPQRKTWPWYETVHVPCTWTDPSARPEQRKRDMKFGTWIVRRLYRSGSIAAAAAAAARELATHKLN